MERYFVHYKGGLYKFISIANNSETMEEVVVYQALYGSCRMWVRPSELFFGKVLVQGVELERFREVTKEEMLCLLQKKTKDI